MCNCDHNQVSEYSMLIFIEHISKLDDIALKTKSDHTEFYVNFTLRAEIRRPCLLRILKIELPDEVNIF